MAAEDAVSLAALDEHQTLDRALDDWFRRRRDRALFVAEVSLVLLKQESGRDDPTPNETQLLKFGILGAQARLAHETY